MTSPLFTFSLRLFPDRLHRGNTVVCATVYSLGFILPTLSGMFFWNETVTFWKLLGILTVFPALLLSGTKKHLWILGLGFSAILLINLPL